jgi:hypothetical protein
MINLTVESTVLYVTLKSEPKRKKRKKPMGSLVFVDGKNHVDGN